jgi:hypothetical protein
MCNFFVIERPTACNQNSVDRLCNCQMCNQVSALSVRECTYCNKIPLQSFSECKGLRNITTILCAISVSNVSSDFCIVCA